MIWSIAGIIPNPNKSPVVHCKDSSGTIIHVSTNKFINNQQAISSCMKFFSINHEMEWNGVEWLSWSAPSIKDFQSFNCGVVGYVWSSHPNLIPHSPFTPSLINSNKRQLVSIHSLFINDLSFLIIYFIHYWLIGASTK